MTKTTFLFSALTLAGIGCAVLFNMIGSHVDENGVLREPFYLVGLGYLFFAIGAAGLLATAAHKLYRLSTARG